MVKRDLRINIFWGDFCIYVWCWWLSNVLWSGHLGNAICISVEKDATAAKGAEKAAVEETQFLKENGELQNNGTGAAKSSTSADVQAASTGRKSRSLHPSSRASVALYARQFAHNDQLSLPVDEQEPEQEHEHKPCQRPGQAEALFEVSKQEPISEKPCRRRRGFQPEPEPC